jgi:hypothetical protein
MDVSPTVRCARGAQDYLSRRLSEDCNVSASFSLGSFVEHLLCHRLASYLIMLSLLHLVCLAVAVRASPLPSHVHQHARSFAPNGFSHVGAATPEQQINFRVALKASNVSGLAAKLASISDPRSATYGQWLTAGMCACIVVSQP